MFGMHRTKRRKAEDAWDGLVSKAHSAGDSARSVGRRTSDLAGDAQSKVSSVTDEALTRASMALEALAGRRPSKPWGWIAVAVLGGMAAGWALAASAPKAVSSAWDKLTDSDPTSELGPPTPTGTTGMYTAPAAARTSGTVPTGPPAV